MSRTVREVETDDRVVADLEEQRGKHRDWTAMVPAWRDEEPDMLRHTITREQDGKQFEFVDAWPYHYNIQHPYTQQLELRVLFWRARYQSFDGEKQYHTWYASNEEGKDTGGWRRSKLYEKLLPALPHKSWPLYGNHLLEKYPDAEVWLVEGEKCADYVNNVLQPEGVVAVSASCMGAVAHAEEVRLYNTAVLWDRYVVVWPDNDVTGHQSARLFCLVNNEQDNWVYVDLRNENLPEKWDLADLPETEGVDVRELRSLARSVKAGEVETFKRWAMGLHADSLMPKNGDVAADGRRTIQWLPTQPEVALDNALPFLREDRRLYNLGGRIVRIGHSPLSIGHTLGDDEEEAPMRLAPQAPNTSLIQSEVNRTIEWGKIVSSDEGEATEWVWRPQDTPQRVAKNLEGMGGEGLSPLLAVVDYPCYTRDGRVLRGTYYDERTHLYVDVPRLGLQHKTAEQDAKAAYRYLLDEVFCDVAFETPEDEAMLVCAMLSLLVKKTHAIITPAFVVTATTQQTGKTVLCNMVSSIVFGAEAPAVGWGDTSEERRKQLLAIGLANSSMVVFDNIKDYATIECPHHSAATTNIVYEDRQLAKNKNIQVPSLWVAFFTGNNLGVGTDFASRAGFISLDAKAENPMEREFMHPDPQEFVLEHRNKILEACFTILAAHQSTGRKTNGKRCRFPKWASVVRDAVLAASGVDAWTKEIQATNTEDLEALVLLAKAMDQRHTDLGTNNLTAKGILEDTDLLEPAFRDALSVFDSKAADRKISPRLVGHWLRKWSGRVLPGGLRIGFDSRHHHSTFFVCTPDGKPKEYEKPEGI